MEVDEQIKIFREFIEKNYYPQLLEAVRKGQKYLTLDFAELVKYNTEIVENVVDDDGWTVSINKKKIKREQVNIEKKIIEMQLNQIHTELN